ncbi:MAG: 4-hydroxy-tetrahydrodipicolinate synthase [Clostridia bacterium]
MSIFKGCATALVTPFTADGVDYEAYGRLIDFQIANDIDALVVAGTTGEPSTMTKDEKLEVIRFAIKRINRRVPVIVGTGGNNTSEVILHSQAVEKLGADALLIVTPYYNKCTQRGLIAHYTAIAESVSAPIICYNVPGRTGVNILPQTFAEIAKLKNIVAIKEASGNMEQISETIRLSDGLADVISGDDGITVPIMSVGGSGVISVASNVAPKFMHDMTVAYLNGETTKAGKMQLQILPLVKALFSEVNPIPVKYGVSLLGFGSNILRLPLMPITDENAAILKRLMCELNLLK